MDEELAGCSGGGEGHVLEVEGPLVEHYGAEHGAGVEQGPVGCDDAPRLSTAKLREATLSIPVRTKQGYAHHKLCYLNNRSRVTAFFNLAFGRESN